MQHREALRCNSRATVRAGAEQPETAGFDCSLTRGGARLAHQVPDGLTLDLEVGRLRRGEVRLGRQ